MGCTLKRPIRDLREKPAENTSETVNADMIALFLPQNIKLTHPKFSDSFCCSCGTSKLLTRQQRQQLKPRFTTFVAQWCARKSTVC
ncbi:hypothetical protein GWI33_010394 [Rhynchophorus ferrugineus]|uniref:Uncharacterized protein n=1 Tax=Rhynchophorus ferrugineus TaxID=354439 RepID=A0A834IR15_RHYFE|nr:hypothetical protein GWI33_010394 [Rhynchophorus ferrugineus]